MHTVAQIFALRRTKTHKGCGRIANLVHIRDECSSILEYSIRTSNFASPLPLIFLTPAFTLEFRRVNMEQNTTFYRYPPQADLCTVAS